MQEFISELEKFGYRIDKQVVADNKINRLFYGDEKKTSGRYCLKIESDGFACGWFTSEKDGYGIHKWHSKKDCKDDLSPDELAKIKRENKKQQANRLLADKRRQDRLSKRLTKLYDRLPPAPENHPYIAKKGVKTHGIKWRKKHNQLIIPVYQNDGNVYSFQRVYNIGDKTNKIFTSGGKIEGGYFILGDDTDDYSTILVAEGFSTAASIREATNLPVAITFNSGNMPAAALNIKVKFPNSHFVFCSDNDIFTIINKKPVNIGVKKAQQSAVKIGGAVVIFPEFEEKDHATKPTDWNDAHLIYGLEYVNNKIRQVLPNPVLGDEACKQ